LTLPAAVATVLLGRPVIVTLFQGGAFDEQATQLVFAVLVAFSVRIVAESTLDVVARLFYARHNTFVPMITYLGWLVVTVLAAYALVGGRGVVGLALATTLSFSLLALTLLELNRRALGGLGGRVLPLAFLRAAAGAAVMAVAIMLVGRVVSGTLPFLLIGGGGGAAVYVATTWLLGGRELRQLWQTARAGAA